MTSPRAIASLSLIAVLMLLAAIWLTAGAPSATLAVPSVSGLSMPSLPSIAWPDGGLQAPPPAVIAAFAAGWMARWLYALPWASLPRAMFGWLLGWRTRAALTVVAAGCLAVLVLT